jgi:hypothetical protein
LKELKQRFEDTIKVVAEKVGMSIDEVSRDIYTRVSVDTDVEGRLNKEELVEIGGFAKNKDELAKTENQLPKILCLDIETFPMEVYTFNQYPKFIANNQVIQNTTLASYAAKFVGEDVIYYNDVRGQKNLRNDIKLVKELKELINKADFILYFNGIRFDGPKISYRTLANKVIRAKAVQEIDPLRIAKKHLGFDSRKLEHLTDMLCVKYKKLKHSKFPGFDLWKECLKDNPESWAEMEDYNRNDILSLEELYVDHIAPFDDMVPNYASFNDSLIFKCNCGNDKFTPAGYHITKKSKFEKFQCTKCGKTHRSSRNLHSKAKKESLLV